MGDFRRFSWGQSPFLGRNVEMNRQQWISSLSLLLILVVARPVAADWNWPTWLGGKSTTVTKANRKTTIASRPTTVSSKTSSKSSLTNPKTWFGQKPKSKVVSKWPNGKTGTVPKAKKSMVNEEGTWLSRMLTPSEPKPPQSIAEWMDLEQIKP